jgi:hypothetical protein
MRIRGNLPSMFRNRFNNALQLEPTKPGEGAQ